MRISSKLSGKTTSLLPQSLSVSRLFCEQSKPKTGAAGLIGETGLVKKALMPEGKVFVHGELWNATAKDPIEQGAKVRVVKVDSLVLEVEPL